MMLLNTILYVSAYEYILLLKYSSKKYKNNNELLRQSSFVNKYLSEIKKILIKKHGENWKNFIIHLFEFEVEESTIKYWFLGRVSTPILLFEKLSMNGFEKETI